MLAMVVNDDAGSLKARGVLAFLASVRASTGCSYRFVNQSRRRAS
jgi:hypothetical protein